MQKLAHFIDFKKLLWELLNEMLGRSALVQDIFPESYKCEKEVFQNLRSICDSQNIFQRFENKASLTITLEPILEFSHHLVMVEPHCAVNGTETEYHLQNGGTA